MPKGNPGDRDFEKHFDEAFRRYIPPTPPDAAFLTLSSAFFFRHTYASNAIASYEQAFDAMARMLPTQYRMILQGLTSNGDRVEVTFWYDNLQFTPPHNLAAEGISLPSTPGMAILTGQTYACQVTADFHAILSLVETMEERQSRVRRKIGQYLHAHEAREKVVVKAKPSGKGGATPSSGKAAAFDSAPKEDPSPTGEKPTGEKPSEGTPPTGEKPSPKSKSSDIEKAERVMEGANSVEVHVTAAMKSSFPIMVGSKWCRLKSLRSTPLEAWLLGEDPNDIGGWIVLDGKAITCGSVYTHTPNFPMSMHSPLRDIEVYITIMTRRDPFYGNTYQLVPTITRTKLELTGKASRMLYDAVIEITWNQPGMNPREEGSVKRHLSRVPIYALFCYYGCMNHREMCNYIFPGVDSSDERVRALSEMITKGPYHRAFYKRSHPITPLSSLLHIGETILSADAKADFQKQIREDLSVISREMRMEKEDFERVATFLYEERVRDKAKHILDGTFFFNVNHDARKVCMAMGALVAELIGILVKSDKMTDRSNLTFNRVQAIGEQLIGEFKKNWKKYAIDPVMGRINNNLFGQHSWEDMKKKFSFEVTASVGDVGTNLALRMKRAFKSSTKAQGQQPRLLEEVYDPKNIIFVWSKEQEVTIRPSTGEKGTSVTYIRRQVHPSMAFFLCGIQTPEAGEDVGRYHQPTIYATLSTCQMETAVRTLLQMEDTRHPSPNARLESMAESAEEEVE